MRNLLESIAVNSLLRSDAQRSYGDYLGVAFSLPFQVDTNTGMGILFKAYGDAMCYMAGGVEVVARTAKPENVDGSASKEERAQVSQAKGGVLGLLQDAFPNVKNVRAELERGFRFWELVSGSPPSSPLKSSDAFPKNQLTESLTFSMNYVQMMLAVRHLRDSSHGPAIAPDLAEQFEAADTWLRPFALQ